ncbi:MAG: radical SAM family heme chaperone HemW [Candidatus Nanopelagicales bacterium]
MLTDPRDPSPRALGVYVHVPFCATRCGYCDFNTYTAQELGPGATRSTYADTVIAEIRLARAAIADDRSVETVFVGGGTPTLLGAPDLVRILDAVSQEFGLAPGAEVTTEANPDSVDPTMLARLREGGFTRISLGVQSLATHVLATLDRTHEPGRSLAAIAEARHAGFEHVSADLIYATPGETNDDVRESVSAVIEAGIDHLSAYSLIVEEGTRLAAHVRRGTIAAPDDDVAAERYVLIDELATSAGLGWYEVSNWARPGGECRHNLGYWTDQDWWGAGPGAHGHMAGRRWWNIKHPVAYAQCVEEGRLPVAGEETVDDAGRELERVMLAMRLVQGMDPDGLPDAEVSDLLALRLIELQVHDQHGVRIALTRQGRLVADAVVRRLTP